jgi:hypothetical protein
MNSSSFISFLFHRLFVLYSPQIDAEFHKIEKSIDERFGTQLQLTFSECKEILDQIKDDPQSVHFLHPFEPESITFAEYYKSVKCPIDLTTITQRLLSGRYPHFRAFANDMRQVWKNAFIYFDKSDPQHKAAESLSAKFESLLISFLEKAQQRAQQLPEGQPYCFSYDDKLFFWDFEVKKYYYEEFPLDPFGRERTESETQQKEMTSPSSLPLSSSLLPQSNTSSTQHSQQQQQQRAWPQTKEEKIEQRKVFSHFHFIIVILLVPYTQTNNN